MSNNDLHNEALVKELTNKKHGRFSARMRRDLITKAFKGGLSIHDIEVLSQAEWTSKDIEIELRRKL